MLPANAYKAIPGHQAHECRVCGAVPLGQGTSSERFITFYREPAADEEGWIPPALIETVRDEPGQVLIEHRAFDGRTRTVRAKEHWCQGCVAQAARLLGWVDRRDLRDELQQKDGKIAELERDVAAKDERIDELEDAVAHLRREAVIKSVPEPSKRKASAARKGAA